MAESVTLYHGTTSLNLTDILERGLQPRTHKDGNWEACPSREDCVYLTNAYGFYYAIAALQAGEPMLIVEVEVDADNLLPDEDFIGQALQHKGDLGDQDLVEATLDIRDNLELYKEWAHDSLRGLGNAAHHGPVPADAIRRYALVEGSEWGFIFDPIICLQNYGLMGAYYRNSMRWLFDPDCEFEEDRLTDYSGRIRELERDKIKVRP